MYNKRIFTTDTMNKMDSLLAWLLKSSLPYCVSFQKLNKAEDEEDRFQAIVTWFGGTNK